MALNIDWGARPTIKDFALPELKGGEIADDILRIYRENRDRKRREHLEDVDRKIAERQRYQKENADTDASEMIEAQMKWLDQDIAATEKEIADLERELNGNNLFEGWRGE